MSPEEFSHASAKYLEMRGYKVLSEKPYNFALRSDMCVENKSGKKLFFTAEFVTVQGKPAVRFSSKEGFELIDKFNFDID